METVNNFFSLISEKTDDFSGREWVFNEINNWLNYDPVNRQRYFIVTGKAGSGKSTIAARLIEISSGIVKENDGTNINGQDIRLPFSKIKKDFLDASYVISFKDNLSTNPKTLSESLSYQLAYKYTLFYSELIKSAKTSNINIDASQQQIDAETVEGSSIVINIHGSPTAISVFNDLIRTPLESFLRKSPQKELIILIDGLDESITQAAEESDNIISILSNLAALKNVYFVITTRDYDNLLNKFKKNSLIFDISSNKYVNYVNEDVSSFIRLNINKKKLPLEKNQGFTDNMVDRLIKKAEGNFLYIKFVMDAFVEGKINFSQEEVDKMPFGLYGMYGVFFDRMLSQYGQSNWGTFYLPIIRSLLVSFEGLNSNQLSFFTGIEDNLQQVLINLKPFIVLQKLTEGIRKSDSVRYKLYHQSLVEFLKTEYLGDSQNSFYIPEQRGHKKIVEKYYDKTAGKFNIGLLNEYGLRYLSGHLFALFDYDDPEGTDWYAKLLELAKDKEFEEKQRQYFPFETNLPLKTIKRAYEASLEKDDPVSTAEMLLLYTDKLEKIFLESPLSILKNTNLDNSDILEKSLRIADLYDKRTRIIWYLAIAWYLDCKNERTNVQKILDRLFGKELVSSGGSIMVKFFVYSLYDQYKNKMVEIFNHISNDDIYEISSFFFKNNNLKTGIEIFNRIGNEKAKVNIINDLNSNKLDTENSLVAEFIEKCKTSSIGYRSKALSSIAQSLAQSNKLDDAIKAANAIEDSYDRSKALSSIAQSLAQSNKLDDAIKAANAMEDSYERSKALSSIAQSLVQSNKLEEANKAANAIEDNYNRSKALSAIAQSLVQSLVQSNKLEEANKAANAIEDSYSKSIALSSIAQSLVQSLVQSNKLEEANKAANAIEDSYSKSIALSSIAQSLAQSNKLEDAIKTANAIEDSYSRLDTLSSIAQSLAQSNKLDDAAQIANSIETSYSRSEALSKIIAKKLEIGDNFSNMNLQEIIYKVSNQSELSIASLETQKLWNHIMKQCIGYPEIAYNVCLLVAERYSKYSKEIADLILKF